MLSFKELTRFRGRLLHSIYLKGRAMRDGASILVSESAICDWGIWKHWQLHFLSYVLKINACLSYKDSFFFVSLTCGYWETKITRELLNSIYSYSYYHDKLLFQTYSFTSLPKHLWVGLWYTRAPLIYTTPLWAPTIHQDHTIVCALLLFNPAHTSAEKQLPPHKDD